MPDANTQPDANSANTDTTVGELRKQYGPNFAAGYGDEVPIGKVLGRAGVGSVDEYVAQKRQR
jgi:hypothetical protein